MKKIIYGLFATLTGLVLLFSYRTSLGEALPTSDATDSAGTASSGSTSSGTTSNGSTSGGSSSNGSSSNGTTSSGTTSNGSTSSDTTTGLTDGTFTGAATNTRYGPVAVRITVSGGTITAVDVPEYPSGNPRDRQINERAIPILVSETIDVQSTRVHMVSGATYTSEGYLQSLQSAIDQATP